MSMARVYCIPSHETKEQKTLMEKLEKQYKKATK